MARIIVEGMDHDNTRINYVAGEADIPCEAGRLKLSWGHDYLPLVRSVPKNAHKGTLVAKLDNTPIGLFEAVELAIVQHPDAVRVYSVCTGERFKFVMKDIFKVAGGFDNAYKQIIDDPGRFYNGAVRITRGKDGIIIEPLG
ncbi:hypothetical protein HY642_00340 [Candidatus Woesearchaeota archaeon]|nr:hypothetical protein [Candidatus Woesearchaeota archaeon]